jgi:anti-sigma regulatory factor (Ser/Thr protein kinase)
VVLTNRLALHGVPAAPRIARRDLERWLREVGCTNRDDALLVVSELVTNAVVHGRGDPVVVMEFTDDRIRLEVHDEDSSPPVRREPGPGDPGGFGLNIVDQLSEEWGWATTATGKMVWCHVFC